MLMATTFLQIDALIQTFNLSVLFLIGNFTYFSWYTFSGHSLLACFHLLTMLKLHEKYLSSFEGNEYVRRNLNFIFTFIRPMPFLRLLVRVVLNF